MLRSLLPASLAAALCCGAVGSLPAAAQDRSLWLYNGESTTVYGYFLAGEGIYGSCDYDCYDLDLYLYDSTGRLVDSDTLLDSIPIVNAPYTGNFEIQVTMPNCSHSAGCAVEVSSDYGF
ncbi:MAG: hypothetical protein HC926_01095 [Synechococcaceae cyanobacterium SM2_3_60]|nr:hypothetical protein [Synechococcaceae cyanobacterium SM2_3_60]